MKKLLNYALIITALLTITACGWQLRGGIDAQGLDSVYINARNPQSPFAKTLKNTLGKQQATTIESASHQLVVFNEKSTNRTASITSSARAAEYLVVEEATISILGKGGEVLLADTVLRAERSLDFDENQIIGKAEEVDLVQKELLDDLARQAIRRLQHTVNR